ncbi:DUF5103 domain-containing protein [Flavobacterium sp. GT3R68]|uniref:type IX secretion system plug protein n=1 Tax=Flavobacterium sp. GT3R68 TaxID=2594437 RepID=UPI000F896F18|nr:DUF5103 domain-containing protein [Flavobacterium sp. GT3R68]RTY87527.1 DUF5103 domain-containing protein [Flavobacterium sp. GSN2]TRW90438.1 DUF5103 domain-containing protein [Flavobacterium sp. GT3R68]
MKTKFRYIILFIINCFISNYCYSQKETEVLPPYNIKTVAFVQNGQNSIPLFRLTDSFRLEFDDLFGNEANYYYEFVHCNYDWTPSDLSKTEYLQGFDGQRIQEYSNSFNTLQLYSHYRLSLPNRNTRLLVSGNYIIKVLNEDKEVVFSRKFILYEDLVNVPMQVKRSRTVSTINYKQNLDFAITSNAIQFQSPLQNVKVMLLQNGQFNTAITNIKPMYTIGNDLIYKYDAETQFWAGNEFLYFENKDVRAATNNVARIDANSTVYNSHLYANIARANNPYTFAPDTNGNFIIHNLNAEKNEIESDYTWVFFTLSAPAYYGKKDIYINGMFNNYALSPEYKMDYNAEKGMYEKAIMMKQGFNNYQYVVADKNGQIDAENAIDGNFYQTENNYFAIVYYRLNGQRYDRVIGKGVANSVDITN